MKSFLQFDDLDNKRMEINQVLFIFIWVSLLLATSAQPRPVGKARVSGEYSLSLHFEHVL